jgi:hypothetical protein
MTSVGQNTTFWDVSGRIPHFSNIIIYLLCPAEGSARTIGSEIQNKTPENDSISDGSLHQVSKNK